MLVTSCVVTAVLAWSGWRLVQQQRELDQRAVRQELDAAAETFAADIRERLADEGERLDRWLAGAEPADGEAPGGTVRVLLRRGRTGVERRGRLPFVPTPATPTSGPSVDAVFAPAEQAEFALRQPAVAIAHYRRLSGDAQPAIRAGALLRLGRALRLQRDFAAAAEAASSLARFDDSVYAGGVPAPLSGLDALRLTYTEGGDRSRAREVADTMRARLDAGAWALGRTTAEFYRELVATDAEAPPEWHLAGTLAEAWPEVERPGAPARGVRAVQTPAGAAVTWWRSDAAATAVVVALADTVLRPLAPPGLDWRVSDAEDQQVAGAAAAAPPDAVVATHAVGGGAGWSLHVWPRAGAPAGDSTRSRWPMLLALGGTLLFVWAATAMMLRALAHEAGVARLQSDFVAAVSHEFRSPLTAMRQMAEMLDAERVPDESRRRQYYRILAGEAARLQHLVENLLDFGRMEAGRAPVARQPVDLGALVDSVVEEVRRQPRATNATIDVVGPDEAVPLEGDPDGLRLALRNLVENAVKYSPGSAHVTVRWGVEGASAAIAVSDRGLGIASHEHARVFGRFVRGESAAAAHVGGTGVGLAVVQQVVRAHGGEIHLDSRPGEGSTFTMRLPLSATRTEH